MIDGAKMKFAVCVVVSCLLLLHKSRVDSFIPTAFIAARQKNPHKATLDSSSYQNDGPFAFMQDVLEIGGLTKEGKSIYYGVFTKDTDRDTTSTEDAAKLRQLAAENLTNIDDAERARRDQAGNVMAVVSALYVIWASLVADDGGFGGHVLRLFAVMPIFLAYGYKESAKAGL
jgi:hypothetical protein